MPSHQCNVYPSKAKHTNYLVMLVTFADSKNTGDTEVTRGLKTPDSMTVDSGPSLTLDEEALTSLPDARRPVHVYEWLRRLDTVLQGVTETSQERRQEVRDSQKVLVTQLLAQVTGGSPGPPTRHLIGELRILL